MAKILVVDDDHMNRKLLRIILETARYTVLEAGNGLEAIRSVREAIPDLIILDLDMPGMEGPAFVKELRSDPNTAGVKVALYTATTVDLALDQFMQFTGIRHVVPKPVEPASVLRVVNGALADEA